VTGVWVDVGLPLVVPDGLGVGLAVDDGVGGWPPEARVRRPGHLLEKRPGDGAADRDMQMPCEAALGFDDGEVLDFVSGGAAEVLHPPVKQIRQADGVTRGPGVVVG